MSALVLQFPAAKSKRRSYPPRKSRNGHSPDCPKPQEPSENCRFCRSEALEKERSA